MFGITDITTYLIGTILVILLPGPNSLYCLSVSASNGVRASYKAVAGIVVGDGILILLTVLGAGSLLRLYPVLFNGMKMLGGLYLMYLGIKLLIGAYEVYQKRNVVQAVSNTGINADIEWGINQPERPNKPASHNYFIRAMTLSLTNPKAIFFLLAFFVQFVDPAYPHPLLTFLALAAILQIVSLSYLSIIVLAGERLAQRFRSYPWLVIFSMGLVGWLFIGFAVSLWLAQLGAVNN